MRAKMARERRTRNIVTPNTIPTMAPFERPFLLDVGGALNVLSEGRVMETMLVLPMGSATCTAWWTEKVLRS